ncbi:MAG: imidazole glycerol phosphate synthase cyclase subunit [Alphaproteobacteria bacterium]|nr:imidazole glycerol phosphate synthase cyclase subunit [Alphaproteobacteria bacterium]
MLKIRVMPTLLYKDVSLVKGTAFDSQRRVGAALQAIKVYSMRDVDELIFLDIAATPNGHSPAFSDIDDLADSCFMPMTVGGGVRKLEDIRRMLAVGADKVSMNTAAIETPELIRDGAHHFGAQCIVASIDVKRRSDGTAEVYSHCGEQATGRDPVKWAQELEQLGAGEILLTSIERDGTMTGYDVELIRSVSNAVRIPVIASGGAGSYSHMADALRDGQASAVAAAAMFHFTEQTPKAAKQYLAQHGFPTRR